MDLKELTAELRFLDAALRIKPMSTALLFRRAEINGELAKILSDQALAFTALEDLELLIKLIPDNALAWLERGIIYYILDEQDRAIADFSKSLTILETGRGYYNRAEAKWRKLVQKHDGSIASNPVAELEAEDILQDYARAIDLDKDDLDSDYFYNRGLIYSKLRNFEASIKEYNKGLAINPIDHLLFFNRAIAFENLSGIRYSDMNNLSRAIEDYTHAIELAPDDLPTYFNRALCYEHYSKDGRYQDKEKLKLAIDDYTVVVKHQSNNDVALYNRGWAYEHLGDTQKAIRDFEKFIQRTHDRFTAGQLAHHLGELRTKRN